MLKDQIQNFKNNSKSQQQIYLQIILNNKGIVINGQNQVKGKVILKLKVDLLNIPIELKIRGMSCCQLLDTKPKTQQIMNSSVQQNLYNIETTQQNLAQTIIDDYNNFHSTDYLRQIKKPQPQTNNAQDFLQGMQLLLQLNDNEQNDIKYLKANQQYQYPFSFFLPYNLPASINSQIFQEVFLFVDYSIQAEFKVRLFQQQNQTHKNKHNLLSQVVAYQKFVIKRKPIEYPYQILSNSISFKYFHELGLRQYKQTNFLKRFISCLSKLISYQQSKKQTKFDIYNCQLTCRISKSNFLHFNIRVFHQPIKQKLEQKRIKKGKYYSSSKTNKNHLNQQKRNNNEMTISKLNQNKLEKIFMITHVRIRMIGELKNVKKTTIFQRVIALNKHNYDIIQGQAIVNIDIKYFSQQNQLFTLHYWFEIQPLQQDQQTYQPQVSDFSEFEIKQPQIKIKQNIESNQSSKIQILYENRSNFNL